MMNDRFKEILFIPGRLFSYPYGMIMRIRQRMYDVGIKKRRRLPCKVISIGNLSMGGTGKTPHVIVSALRLRDSGLRPAVVTRGYGGRAGKGPVVVSDGKNMSVPVHVAGDEAFMMGEMLKDIPIIAGSDRFAGGLLAIKRFNSDVIILDDGFQHVSLERDIDIVLMSAKSPVWNQHLFPGGELREPVSAISERASFFVITKSELVDADELAQIREMLSELLGDLPVCVSRNEIIGFMDIEGNPVEREMLQPARALIATAIGSPESFVETIRTVEMNISGQIYFMDHHIYSADDLRMIIDKAIKRECDYVITTCKDLVKMREVVFSAQLDCNQNKKPVIVAAQVKAVPDDIFWRSLHGAGLMVL